MFSRIIYLPSILKDSLVLQAILRCQLFTLKFLEVFHCALDSIIAIEKLAIILRLVVARIICLSLSTFVLSCSVVSLLMALVLSCSCVCVCILIAHTQLQDKTKAYHKETDNAMCWEKADYSYNKSQNSNYYSESTVEMPQVFGSEWWHPSKLYQIERQICKQNRTISTNSLKLY